jgi:hypothetical protein
MIAAAFEAGFFVRAMWFEQPPALQSGKAHRVTTSAMRSGKQEQARKLSTHGMLHSKRTNICKKPG